MGSCGKWTRCVAVRMGQTTAWTTLFLCLLACACVGRAMRDSSEGWKNAMAQTTAWTTLLLVYWDVYVWEGQ